jgi:hypothetical protein
VYHLSFVFLLRRTYLDCSIFCDLYHNTDRSWESIQAALNCIHASLTSGKREQLKPVDHVASAILLQQPPAPHSTIRTVNSVISIHRQLLKLCPCSPSPTLIIGNSARLQIRPSLASPDLSSPTYVFLSCHVTLNSQPRYQKPKV